MACMEHNCRDCRHGWFDNVARAPCPRCGSTNVAHDFDEEGDHYDDYGEDDTEF